MRHSRIPRPILFAALLALGNPAHAAPSEVKAVLELSQRFYYAGDPLHLKVSVGNDGAEAVKNPVKTALFKGFEVRDAGGKNLEPAGEPNVSEPARPDKLASKAFYGSIVDLTSIYPQLRERGRYDIRWSADGVSSATLTVKIIPRYDPNQDYRAKIRTNKGDFVIELFDDSSPLAVKNFVDLANADFYDGLLIHEARRDHMLVGGDPTGTGAGGAGYTYPAEPSSTPVVAGTVLMKPVSPAPPANSSQFIVMLRPEPSWTGHFTVLGQITEGFNVAREISRVPTTGGTSAPFFRPTEEVRIRDVVVEAKTSTPSPPDEGGGES